MGQKVNPIGFRVGVYRDWDAQWFPRSWVKGSYGRELRDDLIIRKYLDKNLSKSEVARVEIKKTGVIVLRRRITPMTSPSCLVHVLRNSHQSPLLPMIAVNEWSLMDRSPRMHCQLPTCKQSLPVHRSKLRGGGVGICVFDAETDVVAGLRQHKPHRTQGF